jgi:hypothetical protein
MTRKKRLCFDNVGIDLYSPRKKTIPQAISRMITVRIAVARLEFTFVTPIFAKMAVREAKKADSSA